MVDLFNLIGLQDTVKDAKKIISRIEGIPHRNLILTLQGKILKDKYTINHYSLDKNIFNIMKKRKKAYFVVVLNKQL